jgi:hypothetical protein
MSKSKQIGFKVQGIEEFGLNYKTRRITVAENVSNRQKARQVCRNRRFKYVALYIIHPDGTREKFEWIN